MSETYPILEEARDESKMPDRIRSLPRCPKRKIPVPWFVAWIDGVPEFRTAATRDQVAHSVETGMPSLEMLAKSDPGAMEELTARRKELELIFPAS